MRAPFAQLLFVFAAFGRVVGQRAVRVVSACICLPVMRTKPFALLPGVNTRASIRPSVFGGVHAFSCYP